MIVCLSLQPMRLQPGWAVATTEREIDKVQPEQYIIREGVFSLVAHISRVFFWAS